MALINCPECGKQISHKVLTCPNCGCPKELFVENNKDESDTNNSSNTSIGGKRQGSNKGKILKILLYTLFSIIACSLIFLDVETKEHVRILEEVEKSNSILSSAVKEVQSIHLNLDHSINLDVKDRFCKINYIRSRFSDHTLIERAYDSDGNILYSWSFFINKYTLYGTIFGYWDKPIYKLSGKYTIYNDECIMWNGEKEIFNTAKDYLWYKEEREPNGKVEQWWYYYEGCLYHHKLSTVTEEKDEDSGGKYYDYKIESEEWYTRNGESKDYWSVLFDANLGNLVFNIPVFANIDGQQRSFCLLLHPEDVDANCTQGIACIFWDEEPKDKFDNHVFHPVIKYEYKYEDGMLSLKNGCSMDPISNRFFLHNIMTKINIDCDYFPEFDANIMLVYRRSHCTFNKGLSFGFVRRDGAKELYE